MVRILIGVFTILHGLVHILYAGQSFGFLLLSPGADWPVGSWLPSKLLEDEISRWLVTLLCILAAFGLVVGGLGLMVKLAWWRQAITYMAAFSSLIFILFWNGRLQKLDIQGVIGVLINIGLVIAARVWQWPV